MASSNKLPYGASPIGNNSRFLQQSAADAMKQHSVSKSLTHMAELDWFIFYMLCGALGFIIMWEISK